MTSLKQSQLYSVTAREPIRRITPNSKSGSDLVMARRKTSNGRVEYLAQQYGKQQVWKASDQWDIRSAIDEFERYLLSQTGGKAVDFDAPVSVGKATKSKRKQTSKPSAVNGGPKSRSTTTICLADLFCGESSGEPVAEKWSSKSFLDKARERLGPDVYRELLNELIEFRYRKLRAYRLFGNRWQAMNEYLWILSESRETLESYERFGYDETVLAETRDSLNVEIVKWFERVSIVGDSSWRSNFVRSIREESWRSLFMASPDYVRVRVGRLLSGHNDLMVEFRRFVPNLWAKLSE